MIEFLCDRIILLVLWCSFRKESKKMFCKLGIFSFTILGIFNSIDAQACGGGLSSTFAAQELRSPGYPGPYPTNVDCDWTIRTPENQPSTYVKLTIEVFSLPKSENCLQDYVKVFTYDGEDPTKLCGNGVGAWNYFFSRGNSLRIKFVSDGIADGSGFGFRLIYIAEEDLTPRIIWSERTLTTQYAKIQSLPANPLDYLITNNITTRYFYQQMPGAWVALTNDRRERQIFWSDAIQKRLLRASVGRNPTGKGLFRGTSTRVEGLAVDWVSKNIYVADALYNWILVMNYDASKFVRLITTGLDHPRDVAVHPLRKFLYWTDIGSHRIERSDLAGGNRQVIVSSQLTSPNGITVDAIENKIYWTDEGPVINIVQVANLDGTQRHTIYSASSLTSSFYQITTYAEYIYVTDWNNQLRCLRKSNPGQQYFSLTLKTRPYGITTYAPESQPSEESPCASSPCSYLCVGYISDPGYKCLCPDGYVLLPNGQTCQDEQMIAPPQLFYASITKLCRMPSNFPDMQIPQNYNASCFVSNRKQAVALAVDVEDGLSFFSDINAKTVTAAPLRTGSKLLIIAGGTKSVEGIAVDWISNNVYWTDNLAGKIAVSTYDGLYQKNLITENVIHPRAIAIDPFQRYLFWGEFGPPAQIERSSLDGTDRQVILSQNIGQPNGLTIDYSEQRIYFADVMNGAIQRIDYNGQEQTLIFLQQGANFFGIALFQDYLIWTQFNQNGGIYAINRNTKLLVRSHHISDEAVFGLAMFAESTQPPGEGPCSDNSGGCSQLCLPSTNASSGRTCACAFGYVLGSDGISCESTLVNDDFVLFTDTFLRGVFQVSLRDSTYTPHAVPIGAASNPIAVAYDHILQKVYWTDVVSHTINMAGLDGSNPTIVLSENILIPDGLALDPFTHLLFWTDMGNRTISVANMAGLMTKVLINSGLHKPRAIVAHSSQGLIFWSDWGDHPKIERSYMDGSGRLNIITTGLGWPNGLTIDYQGSKLYWCDAYTNKIEMSDLAGGSRRVLIDFGNDVHPYGIGIYGNSIIWTDWSHASLLMANKLTGANNVTVGSSALNRPNEVHVHSSQFLMEAHVTCSTNNGGCGGLCLPSFFGRTCSCGDLGTVGEDDTTCVGLEDILCPSDFYNGYFEDCDLTPGSNCAVTCFTGLVAAESHVTCLHSGEWSVSVSSLCKAVFCDAPPTLNHVTWDRCPPPFTATVVCEQSCDDTYIRTSGDPFLTCSNDGQWEGELVVCTAVTCGNLPDLENIIWSNCLPPYNPGEICHQQCDDGYDMTSGDATLVCGSDGLWIGRRAVCDQSAGDVTTDLEFIFEPMDSTLSLRTMFRQECRVNDPSAIIRWFKDGINLQNNPIDGIFVLNGGVLFITDVEYQHQGLYACKAERSSDGAILRKRVTFTISLEEIFSEMPMNDTLAIGDTHILQCRAQVSTHSIEWEKEGEDLVMTENVFKVFADNLIIREAISTDRGKYTCVVYDGEQRLAEVSAWINIEVGEEVSTICGTVTAPEAVRAETVTRSSGQSRIVGGQKAVRGSAPWMVRLYHQVQRQHFCGGSLLNNHWIVTAAHCIYKYSILPHELLIRLGDHDSLSTETSEVISGTAQIIMHENYNDDTFDNDIALVRLSNPVAIFTDYIRPICFPNITDAKRMFEVGETGKVTGWGQVAEDGPYPRYMTEIYLPLVGRRRCRSSTNFRMTSNMFCAGYPRESGDACLGDSGGPFAMDYNNRWHLLGLVSWGEGCDQPGKYGFYARIARFINWVNTNISR